MDRSRVWALLAILAVGLCSLIAQPWSWELERYVAITNPEHRCLPWRVYWMDTRPSALPEAFQVGDMVAFNPRLSGVSELEEVDDLIVKIVAALPGDRVRIAPEGVFVNGSRFPGEIKHPKLISAGTEGRILQADEILLLGVTESSFDGRYFGPVPMASVVGSARPALVENSDAIYYEEHEDVVQKGLEWFWARRTERGPDGVDVGGRSRAAGS